VPEHRRKNGTVMGRNWRDWAMKRYGYGKELEGLGYETVRLWEGTGGTGL